MRQAVDVFFFCLVECSGWLQWDGDGLRSDRYRKNFYSWTTGR